MIDKMRKMKLSEALYWIAAILLVIICCSAMSFLMPFRIYCIGLFAVCMYGAAIFRWKNIVVHPIGVLLALFTILVFAGIFGSLNRRETLKYAMVYLCTLPMLLFTFESQWIEKILFLMKKVIFFIACTIILNALIPNLFLNTLNFLIRPGMQGWLKAEIAGNIFSGIAGEKGEAALLMVIGIALGLYRIIRDKRLNKWNLIYLLVVSVAMVLPAKRVLFVIACAFFIIYIFGWMKRSKKAIAIIIGIFILMGTVLFAEYIPGVNTLMQRFTTTTEDNTLNGRSYLWERAVQMAKEKPVFGYGYGSYNTFASYYGVKTSASGSWASHAHNIYLQLLGEMGIIGASLFFVAVIIGIVILIRLHLLRQQMDDEDRGLLFFTECLYLCTLMNGITDNPIYVTNQITMLMLSFALIIHLNRKYIPKIG